MTARAYDMRARTESAAETRAGIIAAAHRLLGRADGTTLTLQELAVEARVSRPTIYNSIGSRAAVLAAVFEDQGRLVGYQQVLLAMQRPDPAAACVAMVEESCRCWEKATLALRRTLALAVVDPEIGTLVKRYEGYRRGEVNKLAARAHADSGRKPELSVEALGLTLSLLSGFAMFDQVRQFHSARDTARHLMHLTTIALGDRSPHARTPA